jgi:hypothetical protein
MKGAHMGALCVGAHNALKPTPLRRLSNQFRQKDGGRLGQFQVNFTILAQWRRNAVASFR